MKSTTRPRAGSSARQDTSLSKSPWLVIDDGRGRSNSNRSRANSSNNAGVNGVNNGSSNQIHQSPSNKNGKQHAFERSVGPVQGIVTGMSMQGKGTQGFGWFKKEIVETFFNMNLSCGSIKWAVSRSFNDFKRFYESVLQDPGLISHQSNYKRLESSCLFPIGEDGETDVMVLVERKEILGVLLQQLLLLLDIRVYYNLNDFLSFSSHVSKFIPSIRRIQRVIRRKLARMKFNQILFQHYSRDIINITYLLEDGIRCIDHSFGSKIYNCFGARSCYGFSDHYVTQLLPSTAVLWLDVCEDPTLTRICVSPKAIFDLPMDNEDLRLANGIFLSDISEIRHGIRSFGFSPLHVNSKQPGSSSSSSSSNRSVNQNMCLSIIGLERCLDIEIDDEVESYTVEFLIDMLRLMQIQALSHDSQTASKNKLWKRCEVGEASHKLSSSSELSLLQEQRISKLPDTVLKEAATLKEMLVQGIPVDEEMFESISSISSSSSSSNNSASGSSSSNVISSLNEDAPMSGLIIQSRVLRFDEVHNTLVISPATDNNNDNNDNDKNNNNNNNNVNNTTANGYDDASRYICVDDIGEVRCGKFLTAIEGESDNLCTAIIASESILILPLSSIELRDNLTRHFQSFVEVYKHKTAVREASLYDFFDRYIPLKKKIETMLLANISANPGSGSGLFSPGSFGKNREERLSAGAHSLLSSSPAARSATAMRRSSHSNTGGSFSGSLSGSYKEQRRPSYMGGDGRMSDTNKESFSRLSTRTGDSPTSTPPTTMSAFSRSQASFGDGQLSNSYGVTGGLLSSIFRPVSEKGVGGGSSGRNSGNNSANNSITGAFNDSDTVRKNSNTLFSPGSPILTQNFHESALVGTSSTSSSPNLNLVSGTQQQQQQPGKERLKQRKSLTVMRRSSRSGGDGLEDVSLGADTDIIV